MYWLIELHILRFSKVKAPVSDETKIPATDLAHNGWCPRLSLGGLEGSIPFKSALINVVIKFH